MAKSRFLENLEFIPAKVIMVLLRLIPFRLAVRAGALFGMVVYRILPGERRRVHENLRTAFADDLDERARRRLCWRVFINLGKTIFEFMQFPKLSRKRLLGMVRFENLEAMENALQQGRGAIAVTGHLGNWEMLAAGYAAMGLSTLHAIVRPLDNRLLDRYVESFREKKGVQPVPRGVALKEGVRALKGGSVLAFLMDQNSAMHGVFVPFFGKPAATVQGPAIMAMKYKSPVIFCFDRRNKDGSHSLIFHDEIPLVEGGTREETILLNTARYTAAIEQAIRDCPEQWLWMHPRWRTRPPGEQQ